jgi:1-phosphatidylinositol phosphodiesterase
MKDIEDNVSLKDLTIPGTHDSGTAKIAPGYGHTQNFSIDEQLEHGIRFLDIRLVNDTVNKNNLKLWHGPHFAASDNLPLSLVEGWISDCDVNFLTVLQWCSSFLETNPSETILMCVKNETKDEDITENLAVLILEFDKYFYKGKDVPKMEYARKKIVLFKRFCNQDRIGFGINWFDGWKDNATFSFNAANTEFVVEDVYKNEGNDTNKKLRIVETNLTNAADTKKSGGFYVTFVSVAFNPAGRSFHTPYQYAWGGGTCFIDGVCFAEVDPVMNPSVLAFLKKSESKRRRYGVVALDFYNNQKENPDNTITQSLVCSNLYPRAMEEIIIMWGDAVDYLGTKLYGNVLEECGSKWTTGNKALIPAGDDDPIIKITGLYDIQYAGRRIITQLKFYSKKGRCYGPYGGLTQNGIPFIIEEKGYKINGLFGSFASGGRRSNKGEHDMFLTQIGAYLIKIDNSAIGKSSVRFGEKTEINFKLNEF